MVYSQSVHLGDRPSKAHDKVNPDGHTSNVTSSLTRRSVCLLWIWLAFRQGYVSQLKHRYTWLWGMRQSQSYITTDGQSASLSWCQSFIWGQIPNFYCCQTVSGHPHWLEDGCVVYSCWWATPAQSFSGPSPAGLMTIFYCLRFETPPTCRARSPYLYPPGTGWPGYTPRHWFSFYRLLRLAGLRWRYSNLPPHGSSGWECIENTA
jgi:hypothetical protein